MYCLGTHKRKIVFSFLFQISREEYLKGLAGKDGRGLCLGAKNFNFYLRDGHNQWILRS